jgi:NTE family protein
MSRSINQLELREADIVLRPKLTGVPSTDFSVRTEAIKAGREAALAQLGALRLRILSQSH